LTKRVMEVEGNEEFREKAAQRFAGVFLMPAQGLWSNVGRHRSSIGRGEFFAPRQWLGASVQASTGAGSWDFPQVMTPKLFREFSRLGFRSAPNDEPHHLHEESRRVSTA
jgi:hypothetical protein